MAIFKNPLHSKSPRNYMSRNELFLLLTSLLVIIFTFLFRNPRFRETIRYTIQGIALMPLFYFAISRCDMLFFRFLNNKWVRKLGVYSYVIYLSHDIIIKLILDITNSTISPFFMLCMTALFSILYAMMIDRFIDGYFRKLRSNYR